MRLDELIAHIDDTRPPAPEAGIQALENSLGERLPDAYRAFLLATNGGRARPDVAFLADDGDEYTLENIYGFRTDPEDAYLSILWARDCYLDRIPKDVLVIFGGLGHPYFCLGIRGAARGRVYYRDEEEGDPEEGWDAWRRTADSDDGMVLLAESFEAFVDGLRHEEPEQPPEDPVAFAAWRRERLLANLPDEMKDNPAMVELYLAQSEEMTPEREAELMKNAFGTADPGELTAKFMGDAFRSLDEVIDETEEEGGKELADGLRDILAPLRNLFGHGKKDGD